MKLSRTMLTCLTLAVIASTFLAGCTSSKPKVSVLKINSQPDTLVEVMPFAAATHRFATNDASKRGLSGIILDAQTGIYTYRFDDGDYSNLRKSLVDSLQKGKFFKGVQDITSEKDAASGTRLYIDFIESGMNQTTLSFVCVLKARAWTEDSSGKILGKKGIVVEEKSGISVAAAKNKAIDKFVKEVAGLFSQK